MQQKLRLSLVSHLPTVPVTQGSPRAAAGRARRSALSPPPIGHARAFCQPFVHSAAAFTCIVRFQLPVPGSEH